MSSRQLRKLQKQKDLGLPQDTAEGSEEELSEPEVRQKPKPSLFAALGGDDDNDEDDNDDDDDQGVKLTQDEPKEEDDEQKNAQPAPSKKSKKKKKKKAKQAAGDTSEAAPPADDGQDEIDRALRELNLTTARRGDEPSQGAAATHGSRLDQLLGINTHHLKAINEMRNLFGRDIIESATAEEEEEAANARRAARAAGGRQNVDLEGFIKSFSAGGKKLPEVSLRRNVFIQGKEHWPLAPTGGLTLKTIGKIEEGDDAGATEYAYVHEKDYDAVQALFFSLVQVGDPMRMVYLLREAPYHVSTLLQVSNVAKQDQNMALASELCERALFSFGRVATNAFRGDLERGRARLDFRRPENRQFWLAGYHYLRSLVRKGTYRTALEWAKLLFSLDRQDPYGMRHYIQFLAVRAYEAKWFIEFMDELEKTGNNRDTLYLRQSTVLSYLQLEDLEGARQALETGIKRVPWLYCALFSELNLDAPPSVWGLSSDAPSRSFWVKLYLYQSKDLWNNPPATALLQSVAQKMDRVDTASLPADDPPPDLGATRLAFLEGQTSLIAAAPRQYLDMQPNYEFDPLPPPREENIFTGAGAQLPFMAQAERGSSQPASEIEARMENILARQQARAQAVGGNDNGEGDGNGFTDEEMAAILEDDQELARDLEAHANRPGMLQMLRQFLGGNPDQDLAGDQATGRERENDGEGASEGGDIPGAWPDEQDPGNGTQRH
ncbi:transcriptional repressor TCF25 domain-containing protein [Sarocladium implicatum]|nr:transcriptional repressor TCF25 domain-containing protein [Sarocladium implicatum]